MILVIHDEPNLADAMARLLGDAKAFCTARQALNFIHNEGLRDVECVIIHASIGSRSEEKYTGVRGGWLEEIVAQIHERAEFIRIGVVTGAMESTELVDYRIREMGVDFMSTSCLDFEFITEQAKKGYLSPNEMEARGRQIEVAPSVGGNFEIF